jgi:hypothetical protein
MYVMPHMLSLGPTQQPHMVLHTFEVLLTQPQCAHPGLKRALRVVSLFLVWMTNVQYVFVVEGEGEGEQWGWMGLGFQ